MVQIPEELLFRAISALFNAYPHSRVGLELQAYLPTEGEGD